MISLKKLERGFTIIELLIVVAVIGILALIVLNSISGVQAKARDADRKADISAVRTQLEVFFNENNAYPELSDLQDSTWVSANLEGIDADALVDPDGVGIGATGSDYGYTPTPADCEGVVETGETTACTAYTLTADLEEEADLSETSLN